MESEGLRVVSMSVFLGCVKYDSKEFVLSYLDFLEVGFGGSDPDLVSV